MLHFSGFLILPPSMHLVTQMARCEPYLLLLLPFLRQMDFPFTV